MEDIGPAWLNLKAASRYTGLGDCVLRRLVNDPQGLPHVRISGRIIIARVEIDHFLAALTQTGKGMATWGISVDVRRRVEAFITECCMTGPGHTGTAGELYRAFKDGATAKGVEFNDLMGRRTFGIILRQLGFMPGKSGGGVRLWRGVALRVSAIAPLSAKHCATI